MSYGGGYGSRGGDSYGGGHRYVLFLVSELRCCCSCCVFVIVIDPVESIPHLLAESRFARPYYELLLVNNGINHRSAIIWEK